MRNPPDEPANEIVQLPRFAPALKLVALTMLVPAPKVTAPLPPLLLLAVLRAMVAAVMLLLRLANFKSPTLRLLIPSVKVAELAPETKLLNPDRSSIV